MSTENKDIKYYLMLIFQHEDIDTLEPKFTGHLIRKANFDAYNSEGFESHKDMAIKNGAPIYIFEADNPVVKILPQATVVINYE